MRRNSVITAHAYLVESIPKGLDDLRGTPGVQYTETVLAQLTKAARTSIDITAMYWALLPDPNSDDEKGFSKEQFTEMGADAGYKLYQALREAASRGVFIRILQSPGFSGQKQESDALQKEFPDRISIYPIEMGKWYGGSGIMHQKIWIFDSCHIYMGSANMDWKSITQVKEIGIVVEDCSNLALDAKKYFDTWCAFSALPSSSTRVYDPTVLIYRMVPPWSSLVSVKRRKKSPLIGKKYSTKYNYDNPLMVELDGEAGGVFLTGSPLEVRGEGRSWDNDGLVETINDARKSVCISVMDFSPTSLYGRESMPFQSKDGYIFPNNTPVWWPSLFSSILSAVLTRKVYVRLLVSKWAHTSGLIEPFLHVLQSAADAGRADQYMTAGQLEIKQFIVPGWDNTSGASRKYPGHTRVNHTKYIVTDRRINIGTSNMTWDYFASTAGSSFNSNHMVLVRTLQQVFDRDWASSYAFRLTG